MLEALLTLSPARILDVGAHRDKAFARFWTALGPAVSADMPAPAPRLLATVRGVVLDVGPGSGEQLRHFRADRLRRVCGCEPAEGLHAALRASAAAAGLGAKYDVLKCGAEPESLVPALARAGLLREGREGEGIFDEVVCVRVLCGVPRLEETVAGLYRLLKPGGRLVVCEHVVNPWRTRDGSVVARGFQWLYMMLGWTFFVGGCHLDRDTERVLKEAAGRSGWANVELEPVDSWGAIPYVVGVLVKSNDRRDW